MCFSHSLTSAYTHTVYRKKKTETGKPGLIHSCSRPSLPHSSSILVPLITHAVFTVWLPSLLIALGTQVCLWSSSSNCSGLAWGEEGCSRLTSGSAPWPHDWIHASMFDEMDSVSSFSLSSLYCCLHWVQTILQILYTYALYVWYFAL